MAHDEHDRDANDHEEEPEGQVSEMAVAGDEPQAISAEDSVAGQPEQESGDVQEGAQGPNAIPDDPTGEHPHTT
ncbi:hypothetical protein [Nocardioides hwasunensis]|uniref:Uncharacterized protein n=1 Tax=Nocardioides hwasunensis TaxID=397258 RepID=A0ABR8MN34_9ACTN|nr:hypothetical protein [Nocardioides hwasunensis]MBD3915944.1 hypothetical protein [Nocardioides hwasunensis]